MRCVSFALAGDPVTRDELYALAQRHSDELWAEDHGEIGRGHKVLEQHGIGKEDATHLALTLAQTSVGTDTLPGLAALFIQGLIFGLWLADERAWDARAAAP